MKHIAFFPAWRELAGCVVAAGADLPDCAGAPLGAHLGELMQRRMLQGAACDGELGYHQSTGLDNGLYEIAF